MTPAGFAPSSRTRGAARCRSSRVDYATDLHDAELFTEPFAELKPMRAHGAQTVTLPSQVAGFAPIPFEATKLIPLPRPPKLGFAGTRGNPFDGEFTVFLDVQNTNPFPMDFGSVETHITLNGKRYDLLRTESFGSLPVGGTGRVALTMQDTLNKRIGMIIDIARNEGAEFSVGGTLSCRAPHGMFVLPVEIGSQEATPGR